MRRVLITGATTPFGVALSKRLLADPATASVIAVGREPLRDEWALPDPRYQYVATDLTRSRKIRDLLWSEAKQVDTIVHAAQHRSVMRVGRPATRLNVEATRLFLRLAEEHPTVKRLVYRSSHAIYKVSAQLPSIIDEDHPLNLEPNAPQWIRDRVEADLIACTRMGMSSIEVVVLRAAECVAPMMGSQLYDYLTAAVCFVPLGFDPMVNIISIADLVRATSAAIEAPGSGLYNIPGADTLPLTELIRQWGHEPIPAPGFTLGPLYRMRAWYDGSEFRYGMNNWRFHFNGVLSGERAARALGLPANSEVSVPASTTIFVGLWAVLS